MSHVHQQLLLQYYTPLPSLSTTGTQIFLEALGSKQLRLFLSVVS